ncbi:MAG: hypothetical protein JZU50_11925 [Desulfobulbaceae bacterium]|jgi:hypothetical protein|nr:hypothetical protein [Desulfobulbaceae bacterium]
MRQPLIEYRKIGLLATVIGNERIRVDSDGGLYYSRNSHAHKAGELWSESWQKVGRLDAVAVSDLLRAIRGSGVLALPPVTVDEAVEGGKREELLLLIDQSLQHYVVQNSDQPAFRKAVQLLWGALAGVV